MIRLFLWRLKFSKTSFMKIKKNDNVLVISGKNKGKKGKVLEAWPKASKIVVAGVNIVKKHRRPKREGEKGQVVEIAKPIDVSNVKLICPKCGQATRLGYRISGKAKTRICKKCKQAV